MVPNFCSFANIEPNAPPNYDTSVTLVTDAIFKPSEVKLLRAKITIANDGLHLLETNKVYKEKGFRVEEGVVDKSTKEIHLIVRNMSLKPKTLKADARIAFAKPVETDTYVIQPKAEHYQPKNVSSLYTAKDAVKRTFKEFPIISNAIIYFFYLLVFIINGVIESFINGFNCIIFNLFYNYFYKEVLILKKNSRSFLFIFSTLYLANV